MLAVPYAKRSCDILEPVHDTDTDHSDAWRDYRTARFPMILNNFQGHVTDCTAFQK